MIYTFYSFKGGVGRSMALANVAELMFRLGLRVLLVDFDLEAPGLERFFNVPEALYKPDEVLTKRGIIEMLNSYKELYQLPRPSSLSPNVVEGDNTPAPLPLSIEPLTNFVVPMYTESANGGTLSLIPAGRRDGDEFTNYARQVRSFDWDDLYTNQDGERFFEWFRLEAEQMADVILVDSRTGVSEMSGVCTYQLADIVVMFVAPNQQNLDGTLLMARSLADPQLIEQGRTGRPLSLLFVPSRVEQGEGKQLDAFALEFDKVFGKLIDSEIQFDKNAFVDLKIPYVPYYAFMENVAVRDSDLPSASDLAQAFERLIRVLGQLRGESNPLSKTRGGKKGPVFFVPYRSKGELFIGRDAALKSINQQLLSGRRTVIGQAATLQGLGGTGKTQLAVEYAYRYRDQYPNGVIWLNADQDIDAQLIELSDKAGWVIPTATHKQKIEVALKWLRTTSDCLIIFDNVQSLNSIEPYLPEPQVEPHILVTSRTQQPGLLPIPLDVLNDEESFKLLIQEAGRTPSAHAEVQATNEIVRTLSGLPLAIVMAGAYLSHRNVGWQQYRDLLNQSVRSALPNAFLKSSFTKHEADIHSTLKISESVFAEEPELLDILNILTWSSQTDMGISLLSALMKVQDSVDLTNALGVGVALSFLQKNSETERYAIHRLIQSLRREEIPLAEKRGWVNEICRRLGNWFEERRKDFAELNLFETELAHLNAWQDHAARYSPDQASRLTWLQAYPFYARGHYREAKEYLEKARELINADQENYNELVYRLSEDLNRTNFALGDYRPIVVWGERELTSRMNALGERHPEVVTVLLDLGQAYGGLGDYVRSREYLKKALAISVETLGERHTVTATALNGIGQIHILSGNYKRASEYFERALAIRLELLGERHPDVAVSFDNVARAYRFMGGNKRALEFAEKALAIQFESVGEWHPSTAKSLSNIAMLYGALGSHERAVEYAEKSLLISQKLLGDETPDAAAILALLGNENMALGDHNQAMSYLEKALKMRKEILGELHPNTIASVYDFANALSDLGRRLEANHLISEYWQKIPHDHPEYDRFKAYRQRFLSEALRPGFRQPPTKKKTKSKKRRR